MSTKTKADLTQVGYYYYASDLKIEPIIKAKHSGEYYELKTTKTEDVDVVNGEITVVTTEVTALKTKHREDEQVYGPNDLKVEIEKIAALAKANNAILDGQVVIRESDGEDRVYRVLVVSNKVSVEQGAMAVRWPDGTTSDLPKGND